MIHFVGAGCGAPDLITLRGKKHIENADVIIYAGSLVNKELLDYAKKGCAFYDSAKMTLEEIIAVIDKAEKKGLATVRLHTGDPSLYGAIGEQMQELDKLGFKYDITPGVSAFSGAAAALEHQQDLRELQKMKFCGSSLDRQRLQHIRSYDFIYLSGNRQVLSFSLISDDCAGFL